MLTHLATVEPSSTGSLRAQLDTLAKGHQGGLLVVVLGRATSGELEALGRLRRQFRPVVCVVTEGSPPTSARVRADAVVIIDASTDDAFAAAWHHRFGNRALVTA